MRNKLLLLLGSLGCLTQLKAQPWVPSPTYGVNGATNTDIGSGYDLLFRHAMQPDGKLLLCGMPVLNGDVISLMRLDAGCGVLDTSFGNGGAIAHQFMFSSVPYDMILLQNGKILCTGREVTGLNIWDHLNSIYRFMPDGSIDTSFNHTGYRTDRFDPLSGGANVAVFEAPGGGYFAVGRSAYNNNGGVPGFGMMRYTENGELDPAYSGDGKSWFPPPTPFFYMSAETALLLPDTSIIYIGGVGNDIDPYSIHLAKFLPDGALDPAFGTNGQVVTSVAYGEAGSVRRISAVLMPDGRFLLGVRAANQKAMVACFMPDGTLDTTYGVAGISEMDPTANNDIANGLQLLPDGGTLQFGSNNNGTGHYILKRTADGTPDASFGTNGVLMVPDITGDQYIGGGVMLDSSNVIVYGRDGYPNAVALTIKMTTDPNAGYFADLGPDIQACVGETVQLDAGMPGSSYLWSTSGTQQVLPVTTSGNYSVVITTAGGCSDGDTIAVSFSAPPEPSITFANNLLSTNATTNLQWYVDGIAIPGATGTVHEPLVNGTYTVSTTDANGCSTLSDPLVVLNVGMNEAGAARPMRAYPNPATEAVWIEGIPGTARRFGIHATDGRLIRSAATVAGEPISLGGLAPGSYLLVALDREGHRVATTPFVKH